MATPPRLSPPFYQFEQGIQHQTLLRSAITLATRRPETECVPPLVDQAAPACTEDVQALATRLVRAWQGKQEFVGVASLMQEFSLSSHEGVALMCLAEALLRIPDQVTRDALIRDKVSQGDWVAHARQSSTFFAHAAAWGLVLTGKVLNVGHAEFLSTALSNLARKGGQSLIRKGLDVAMRVMGEQFVAGQTIADAVASGRKLEASGFRFSYDMLGEAAITAHAAKEYYASYEQAIHVIGIASQGRGIYEGPGVSIKLSALHPRYLRSQRDRVMAQLLPRVLALAKLARSYDIGLNIDAEEADRLDVSLDIFSALCFDKALAGWNGLGFVVQAYQKRAPFVIDYLIDLATRSGHRLMLRLVKGAYWDTEIKRAQVDGLDGYPVYTRKIYTDIAYLACARKLLAAPLAVYPQFATHNAYTVAAIYQMAEQPYYPGQYEFQRLHGMGQKLYEEVVGSVERGGLNRPCRIYAPVGSYDTLLAYLVRRLLENGANTSFVHQINNKAVTLDVLVRDPVQQAKQIEPLGQPHPMIVLPRYLYTAVDGRLNSMGLDLNNELCLNALSTALLASSVADWRSAPLLGCEVVNQLGQGTAREVRNPANHDDLVGYVVDASLADVDAGLAVADQRASLWQATPVDERAQCLLHAAQLLEDRTQSLLGLIVREAGKSLPSAVAEVREAVDFLRYYANQIQQSFSNTTHGALGPVVCISPWNFPLSIFIGQIAAALAAGNSVLAKPAEQTSLVARAAVAIFSDAGVPDGVVQLLPGLGPTIGAALVASPLVQAVLFTGSFEVAQEISRTLSRRLGRNGQPVTLIAETGGQNAMVVDSSALSEQVVLDVLASAFDSAGQRCSALRVLCVQDDCADSVLAMLRQAMNELRVGNPDVLSTDVGPVIDAQAQKDIQEHIQTMRRAGYKVDQISLDQKCERGTFVAPTLIEIEDVSILKKEVFGPVLHIVRYERDKLDTLIEAINVLGYGLTFGVQTRIDQTAMRVGKIIAAGNVYINRNMIGAVVGVQPFGGQGLSGTGPKAGGPLYLLRLLVRRPTGLPAWYKPDQRHEATLVLPGPTGERNLYQLKPRGAVLCIAVTRQGILVQRAACFATGNRMLLLDSEISRAYIAADDVGREKRMEVVSASTVQQGHYQAVLFEGSDEAFLPFNQIIAEREGPIISVQKLTSGEISRGLHYVLEPLLREVSFSINTAAVGANASLAMLD